MDNIIVGIDIGTSKVCTVIGKVDKDNQMEILGKGIDVCNGVKKGVIVDIDSTSNSIKNSVEQAENTANLKVGSAYVNIFGTHVSIINNRCIASISNEDREITAKDVERALYSAKNVNIPDDREIIDIITRQYIVDGYDEIIDPVGMVGVKLEADTDIIAGKITSVQNIVKSLERANVKIDGIVIEALAISEVALSADEKDMGVILIDIGGGLTDISVFKRKNLIFYDSIPVGGDHITNDISIGLKIPYAEAERIKKEYELALTSLIKNDQEITVSDINGSNKKSVRVSEVVEIIEARVHEIFSLCRDMLSEADLHESLGAGIVLTGGGISYVDGGKEIAAEVFEIPVRLASYRQNGIPKPEYATAAGIVKYISNRHKGTRFGSEIKIHKQKVAQKESKILGKVSKFFKSLF
ncbi:MAG: cell division protein FtsA [Clostridia bacterium]|nr:cell division protein FtsA [Clostridia bacterium]